MVKSKIIKNGAKREVEASLEGIGFEFKIEEDKISIDPNRLTERTSRVLGMIRDFNSKRSESIKVSNKGESLKEEVFTHLNRMITPIKLRVMGNIVLSLCFIIVLSIMLNHIWKLFFSIVAVTLFMAFISLMVFASIQLFLDLKRSDAQILARGRFIEHNGKYEMGYDTFLRGLRKQKYWGILFSSILLAAFLSGILFNIPFLNYISSVADSLGYIFAIVFLVLSNPRKSSVAALIFLFALFEVKNVTNSHFLELVFLTFDAFLYISFFIFLWYDVLTFKDSENTSNQPDIS
ncbi:MAG: hypothetical protein ACYCR2_05815 [Thermoplasmataceae archaeon]